MICHNLHFLQPRWTGPITRDEEQITAPIQFVKVYELIAPWEHGRLSQRYLPGIVTFINDVSYKFGPLV